MRSCPKLFLQSSKTLNLYALFKYLATQQINGDGSIKLNTVRGIKDLHIYLVGDVVLQGGLRGVGPFCILKM